MKLYVGNLPPNFNDQDLRDLFVDFAEEIVSAKMIIDRETGRSKGFGFVELTSKESGTRAIEELNKKVVGKGSIIVNEARPQEKRENRSFGGGGGGFGGGNRRPSGPRY